MPDPRPTASRPTTWPFDLVAGASLVAALFLARIAPALVGHEPGWQDSDFVLGLLAFLFGGLIFPIACGLAVGRRRGRTGRGAAAGLLVSAGLLGYFVLRASFDAGPETSPEALARRSQHRLVLDVNLLQSYVLQYAEAHGGRPPTITQLRTETFPGTQVHYLSSKLGGWAPTPPGELASLGETLVGVARNARGEPYTPEGPTPVKGHAPAGARYDSTTFGAIVYDVDPRARRWVIYGLGSRDGKLDVVRRRHEGHGYDAP